MKKILLYFSLFFLMVGSFSLGNMTQAQVYFPPANFSPYMDWIDYDKTYYRIIVTQDGLYRLSFQELVDAGISPNINPKRIQMYYHGVEIPIHVSGEADGRLDSLDYVEFYGKQRDSEHDKLLYPNPETDRPTPEISIYGTRSVYFLTFTKEFDGQGRRMQVSDEQNTQNLPAEPYHIKRQTQNFSNSLVQGPLFPTSFISFTGNGAIMSDWEEGKGFAGSAAFINPNQITPLARINITDYVSTDEINTKLGFRMVGYLNLPYKFNYYYGINQGEPKLIGEVNFKNYEVAPANTQIPDSLGIVENGNLTFYYQYFDPIDRPTRAGYTGGYIEYPQATQMNGEEIKKFVLRPLDSIGKSFLRVTNPTEGVRFFDVTNPQNASEIIANERGGNMEMIVPNTLGVSRSIYAISTTKSVESIVPMPIQPILNPSSYDYLILTTKNLQEGVGDVSDVSQAYANYRASEAGGSYTPLVVEMEQLYNIFSYGETTPLATRRFVNYMLAMGQPKFLFILGYSAGFSTSHPSTNFILPYGYPPSDHMLTAGLRSNGYEPAIATGRLSAKKPEDVIAYLNKVKEHENLEGDQSWRKNILHLSGGFSASEHASFKRYVEGFADIATGRYLGANNFQLSKQTTNFIEYIDFSERLNNGLSLITFFGHASINFTDIEIGVPNSPKFNYNNKGRYPMMLVNGCGTGNAFSGGNSIAESWILTPDKGAILFLSHSALGFSGQLRLYTQTFYEEAFTKRENINKPIGLVMQDMIRTYMFRNGVQNQIARSSAQQILLLGDPAVKLIPLDKPDYQITNPNVSIVPAAGETLVNANSDKFRIKFVAQNLGIMDLQNRRLQVRARRTFPDGSTDFMRIEEYPTIAYTDTLYYDISVGEDAKAKSIGINKFEVFLDFPNQISELNEDNNYASIEYVMQRGSMITLAPKEYSIVSETNVKLIAQNSNPFTNVRTYEYELDTTFLFNSSAKRTIVAEDYITTEWNVNLPVRADSTVYYWRVRYADPQPEDNTDWAMSSFIYINDSPTGWSQSDVGQFDKAEFRGVEYFKTSREWEFSEFELNLELKAAGGISAEKGQYFIKLDGEALVEGDCYDGRLLVLAIDSRTGQAYNPKPASGCGASLAGGGLPPTDGGFVVDNSTFDVFVSEMREGDYVVMMNTTTSFKNSRQTNTMPQLGFTSAQIAEFGNRANDAAFILIGQKGAAPGTAPLFNLQTRTDVINETFTISSTPDEGTVTSSLIGPATQWGNLFRQFSTQESSDEWQLDVLGVSFVGSETVLEQDVKEDNFALSEINPNQYPYLKLRATLKDKQNRTAPQLDRWQVIYREVPEGLLLYDTLSYRQNTNLQISAGDSVDIKFRFRNISGNDFAEPLVVRYSVRNNTTGVTTQTYDTLSTLAQGEEMLFDAKFFSLDYLGENTLTVFMNPRSQPEQIYENNILQANFTVNPDDINPVLDVAFDGIHIMDGDVVSPNPLISVQLRDENKFLVRDDTVGINMFLTQCDSCERVRLNYDGQDVQYFASPDNNFRMEYRPEKLPDGEYTLVVEAADLSGNSAGAEPYKVNFEVINKSTITHFYPYPNPFSTKMNFVFTLTGAEIPDDIRIQIMTITGKVVRTITKEELGAIRIGNNVSEFTWDGTDEYGDRLANGVYLYKVDIRDNTQQFEHAQTARDDLFKKNIGKIYIMR